MTYATSHLIPFAFGVFMIRSFICWFHSIYHDSTQLTQSENSLRFRLLDVITFGLVSGLFLSFLQLNVSIYSFMPSIVVSVWPRSGTQNTKKIGRNSLSAVYPSIHSLSLYGLCRLRTTNSRTRAWSKHYHFIPFCIQNYIDFVLEIPLNAKK